MRIYGIIPPMATPFDSNEEINYELLKAEATYLVEEAGVHGLAVGGSTGEGQTLTTDELRQIVGEVLDVVDGRIPVIAGIIVDSTRQAVEKAQALADLEVAALQVTPVHYLFTPTDDMMFKHFATLAEHASHPVMIYNVVPWTYCSPALLHRLMTEIDGIIGVKQSAGDLKLLADLMMDSGESGLIMSAVDALLYPSFCLGAHGAIAAILATVPELCVQLWDAVQAGNHAEALVLHQHLLRIWNAIIDDNLPANVKTGLALQGRPAGLSRSPMPESSPEQKEAIRQALISAGIAVH